MDRCANFARDTRNNRLLGDKEVQVKPGDLVIIPKGTPHGGIKPDGRPFKTIAIKTPPQAPDDTKLLD
jgi:mannose-6-phosphate isomerase-like protein (cupin superfamily)